MVDVGSEICGGGDARADEEKGLATSDVIGTEKRGDCSQDEAVVKARAQRETAGIRVGAKGDWMR